MNDRAISGLGMTVALVLGVFYTILSEFIWFLAVSLLGKTNAFPPLLPMVVAGVLVGLSNGYCKVRIRGEKRQILFSVGAGLIIALIWLLLYGFKASLTVKDVFGALITFPIIKLLSRNAMKDIPLSRTTKGHVELMVVKILRAFGLFFFTLIVVFPFYFMLATSLKSRAEYLMDPANLSVNLLQHPSKLFGGYIEVLFRFGFVRFIMNSAIVAALTVVITLIPSILGAYAVTRLRFRGRDLLSRLILLIYMFPAIVLVIPLYSVFTQAGLRDTRLGLLIIYAAMTIPVALYMLRSYFLTLPADLEEAGLIDGLSRLGVIIRITIPLAMPAIAAIGLYVFMIAWNEFLFAYMFLDTPEIFTLARGMVMLDDQEVPRQLLMAGAVIITVPIMVLFIRFQKHLVGGLTAGGVKG